MLTQTVGMRRRSAAMRERKNAEQQLVAGQRRRSESNRRMEVLQTSALPLGYGAGEEKLAPRNEMW
jgi:hypothetical protein